MNKSNWTYKKLGEVAKIINGKNQKAVEDSNGKYPICGSGGIMGYAIDYLCPENSVIVGRKGNINRPIFMTQKFWNVDTAFGISANEDCMVPKFLFYFCQIFDFQKLNKAVTIPSLVKSDLLKIDLPVPSKETQLNIVNELDSLNDSISMLQQQVADLDSLAQSIFYDMFGDPILNPYQWPIKKIGDIGNVERGAGISKKDFVDSGLPCIHYGQLHTSFGPTAYKNITFIPSNLLPKYKIAHTGDVIMAITSEDVEGSCKSTAWLGDFDLVVGSDAAIYHHSINGVYVSYYTMTKAFYIEKEKYAKGFKVTHISAKEIESIPIPIPPMELQENFAQKVAAIEDSKATFNVQIKELQNLLAARMQYWFD